MTSDQSHSTLFAALLGVLSLTILGCVDRQESEVAVPEQQTDWDTLTQKRVLFAHQSVGANILNGVTRLAKRDGANLTIRQWESGPLEPGISHFKAGRNGEPQSKLDAFRSAVESTAAPDADIALVKLCYIDFGNSTDARKLALDYVRELDALAARYPETIFVAVTAPITTAQIGPKAWLKRMLGRSPGQYVENAKRAEFNQILRDRFARNGRLFDLANIESKGGGRVSEVRIDEQTVQSLDPALTYDGGHLNERGEEIVAVAFLNYLASLPSR